MSSWRARKDLRDVTLIRRSTTSGQHTSPNDKNAGTNVTAAGCGSVVFRTPRHRPNRHGRYHRAHQAVSSAANPPMAHSRQERAVSSAVTVSAARASAVAAKQHGRQRRPPF